MLILFEGQKDSPAYVLAESGMRASLVQGMDFRFEYFIEHMDYYRFKDASYKKNLLDLFRKKYADKKIDLVIANGYHALEFAVDRSDEFFPQTPVVFSNVLETQVKRLKLNQRFTGSSIQIDYLGLLNTALNNHPDTRHVAIISGTSKVSRFIEAQIRKAYEPYANKYDFTYLGHLAMSEMLNKVATLPEHTVVLYYILAKDEKGEAFKPWRVAAMISEAANAPVYGFADTYLGNGIVGGALTSFEASGRKAGKIGLRILNGENPADIPLSADGTSQNLFDWRQLKRWGIHESNLPEGSIVRYKERSLWELYSWYIIGGISFLFFQGLIIFGFAIQRKKARQKENILHQSNERFRAFMENSNEAIWCVEIDHPIDIDFPVDKQFDLFVKHGYVAEANDAYARTVGFEYGKELLGKRIEDFLMLSNSQNVAAIKALIRGRFNIVNVETIESYKEGITRIFLNNASGTLEAGRVMRVWGTAIDITGQKMLENELLKTEQKYRTVADFTYDWEYWRAPDGLMLYASPSCERITGYKAKVFTEDPEQLTKIILPEDRQIWETHRPETDSNIEKPKEVQFRIRRRDGEVRWIEHICQPVHDSDGEFLGVRASNRDITKRKLAEDELKRKDKMLEDAQRIARLGSWDWDILSNKLKWSDEVFRIFGILPQEFGATYSDFLECIHPDDIEGVNEAVKRALADPATNYNMMHRVITPDGIERIVRELGNVTFDDQGNASRMIGTIQDVTDIRKVELEADKLRTELSHMDRVSMMGVLTAGIVHEINQPLAAILSNAQAALRFMKNDPQDLDEVKVALHDIISDDKRAGEIVHSIRNIMGRDDIKRQEMDLNGTVREVLSLVKSEAVNKGIIFSENLQPDIPLVYGDRIQIQQVTLNLMINALDALEENQISPAAVVVSTRLTDNTDVILSVSDTGPGILPDQLNTIFDSFKTTKVGGLGIGLSICRSIADKHGGKLWAENRPEGGAVFFFRLPSGVNRDD